MSVKKIVLPDYVNQTDAAVYKGAIDATAAAHNEVAGQFAPHAADTPNMTVLIDAGRIDYNNTLVSQNQQTVSGFSAPVTVGQSQIDRVVINATTGAALRVAGTPAASPAAPAIPAGYKPNCQILIPYGAAAITNSMITDERALLFTPTSAHRGVLIYKSSSQSVPNNTVTNVTFNQEAYDTDNTHDTAVNNNRIVIPAGVSKVRFLAEIRFDISASGTAWAQLLKNNTTAYIGLTLDHKTIDPLNGAILKLASPALDVSQGDWFGVNVNQSSGGALNIFGGASWDTWLSMDILQ